MYFHALVFGLCAKFNEAIAVQAQTVKIMRSTQTSHKGPPMGCVAVLAVDHRWGTRASSAATPGSCCWPVSPLQGPAVAWPRRGQS